MQTPSYQEPIQAQRKLSKEINRIDMARALETMRHAQLKQGRMNKQNVNRVCEDLLST